MGLDLGTTRIKAIITDVEGNIVSGADAVYELDRPEANAAEQPPQRWWKSTCEVIRTSIRESDISPEKIQGIGLAGQMHSAVFLDDKLEPVRPAITWADNRSSSEAKEFEVKMGRERLLNITYNRSLPGFTAPKVLWLKNHEPSSFQKIHKLTLPKDYIRYKLTGNLQAEKAGASATLLFDLEKEEWSTELLESVGLLKEQMPPLIESQSISGRISAEASKRTGLPQSTPVIAGAGDQQAGALGIGAVKPGITVSTIGTGGQLFATADELVRPKEGRVHVFRQCLPGKWHVMGAMQSAGLALRWFKESIIDQLSKEVYDYSRIDEIAKQAPPGSDKLLFLPYLTGERSPHLDPDARGSFIGLSLDHQLPHMIRSIMEGVVFGMKDSMEIFRRMGLPIKEIRCAGGGGRSSLWKSIQSDIYEESVYTTKVKENAAFGAALLAGIGLEVFSFPGLEAGGELNKVTGVTEPRKENFEIYEKLHESFQALYMDLEEEFSRLASIDAKS